MQRIDPRPEPAQQPQPPSQQDQQQQNQKGQWAIPTGFASTGSQAHTQSFEEIYGIPENFLEIEVGLVLAWVGDRRWQGGWNRRRGANGSLGRLRWQSKLVPG